MALHLVLLVVLFASVLSIESHDLVSDAEALHHIISDLHGQRSAPAIDHPCSTTGVTCDAVSRVTRLSMGSHKLEGSISPAIGGLSQLRELSLPDNLLSGGLPRELAGCRALEILVLRDNRLSGDLPSELSSLLSLRILDLSYNRLTGDVSFLHGLQNLETLSLADNLFSGRVPSFHNLITIDVAGNPDLISEHPNSLRRSLASRRNPNNNKTAAGAAAAEGFAPAPSPSSAPSHRHRHVRHKIRNAAIGFVVGLLSGIASAVVLSLLFRMLVNCVKGRYRGIANAGPTIFSPLIKSAEELAFLEKEDGLASLELIGRGGCGEVYKAQLPGEPGKLVAVKRILRVGTDGREPTDEESQLLDKWVRQVRSEIVTVGHIRHRNLLPLLAHLSRPDCHYLVYEFMKNGSLHDVLDQNRELDWLARHKIATGIASGLEYLHHNHNPHIVHRDLKPGNILLDDDMEARIADFGLAKELPDANTHMTASNVAGTMGYIAPEYHQTLKLTPKCDVYSLGVILGVLVTGMMPSHEFFQGTSEMSLVKWLRNVMGSPSPGDAIDAKMRGQGFDEQVLLVARIAIFCTADEPKDRPTSKDVRAMLSQIKH